MRDAQKITIEPTLGAPAKSCGHDFPNKLEISCNFVPIVEVIRAVIPSPRLAGAAAAMLVVLFLTAFGTHAQPMPPIDLPTVDVSSYPWSSVAKLNNSVGGSCTAAVIGQDAVVTAAHCLFNGRTGRFLPASSLHVLLGYEKGEYAIHARAASYVIGPGYDPKHKRSSIGSDWAILKLKKPLPSTITPLELTRSLPQASANLMVASFARGRRHVLTADKHCVLLRIIASPALLETDCRGAQGTSGAPLLFADGEDVKVVGIQVAIVPHHGGNRMLAVPARSIQAE